MSAWSPEGRTAWDAAVAGARPEGEAASRLAQNGLAVALGNG
jgi:hypothetical protein